MQTNVKRGDLTFTAAANLASKESCLARIINDGGVAKVNLVTAINQYAMYVILAGSAAGAPTSVRPIEQGMQMRLVLVGTCNPGDPLAPDAAGSGGVEVATGDALYHVLALAEEAGVDGQHVLCRAVPATAFVPDAEDHYTSAQVDALLADYATTAALGTALADYYDKTTLDLMVDDFITHPDDPTPDGQYVSKNGDWALIDLNP